MGAVGAFVGVQAWPGGGCERQHVVGAVVGRNGSLELMNRDQQREDDRMVHVHWIIGSPKGLSGMEKTGGAD